MAESDSEDAQSDKAHHSRMKTSRSYHSSTGPISQAVPNHGLFNEEDLPFAHETSIETSVFLDSGVEKDTTWDFATRKFKDARKAMYDINTSDVGRVPSNSLGKEVYMQRSSPEATIPMASSANLGVMDLHSHIGDVLVINPYHQQRPMCGASIGAYHRGEYLPPVSLGGVILVDGEPYGLTVHHILDVPSDDESDAGEDLTVEGSQTEKGDGEKEKAKETPKKKTDQSTVQSLKYEERDDGKEAKLDRTSHDPRLLGKRTVQNGPPDMTSDMELSDDEDEHDVDDDLENELGTTVGDIPGISIGEGTQIKVTQPAIHDVDEHVSPNQEDVDQEHLLFHELGYIYASSGIRQWKRNGIVHEIDWALIKIDPIRLQHYNVVQGGQRFRLDQRSEPPPLEYPVDRRHYMQEEDEYPTEVADADSLAGLHVHCFGRTTGLQGGRIGASMTSVRMHRRETFARSWYVEGGCES
jgi:hypothetical protein